LCAKEHQTQVSAGHVDLRVGRVDQPLPFDSGAFDVVFAVEILHMLKPDSWPAAVREWARCVKPGGRLIIVNPGNLDSVYQAGLLQQVYFGVSLAQLKSLMQAGGLLDVQTLRRGEQEDLLAACIGTAPHSSQQQRKQRREDEDRFQGNVAFT
jgi:SAM-dependent methyltransferase